MVVIIGDSHAHVLRLGWNDCTEAEQAEMRRDLGEVQVGMLGIGRSFLRRFFLSDEEGIGFRSKLMSQRFLDITGQPVIRPDSQESYYISLGFHGVYFYNSSLWNDFSIVQRKDRHFLSAGAFDLMVRRFNLHIFSFLRECRKRNLALTVLSAPYLPSRAYQVNRRFADAPEELALLDQRYRAAVARYLEAARIDYLLPPDGTHSEGVMTDAYCRSLDGDYHGNPAYGKQVLAQIAARHRTLKEQIA